MTCEAKYFVTGNRSPLILDAAYRCMEPSYIGQHERDAHGSPQRKFQIRQPRRENTFPNYIRVLGGGVYDRSEFLMNSFP